MVVVVGVVVVVVVVVVVLLTRHNCVRTDGRHIRQDLVYFQHLVTVN